MSSTNRGSIREVSDYYKTPVLEISNFLNFIKKLYPNIFYTDFLDPCAGGGNYSEMSYPEALLKFNINPDTIDIREDSKARIKSDYLLTDCKNKYDVIITNPPFSLAEKIITKAIDDIIDDGLVIMLLRLNFFGSKKREVFWNKYMPEYTIVHRKRMSFTLNGSTDSIEYMHAIWRKGHNPAYTKLFII